MDMLHTHEYSASANKMAVSAAYTSNLLFKEKLKLNHKEKLTT